MKLHKITLAAALATAMILPIINLSLASADSSTLLCFTPSEQVTSDNCDLSIDKTVSVNDGASTEAPTAAQAVTAKVGDTLTWTITVTNTSSPDYLPDGTVSVSDILPSGVKFVSATPSAGTYSDGTWTFDLGDNLPATLVLVTTASSTGLIENVASLSDYTPPCYFVESCLDPAYADANTGNNTAAAYVNIPASLTVIAAPIVTTPTATPAVKAPETGFAPGLSDPWTYLATSLAAGSVVLGLGYKLRRIVLN